MKRRIISAQPQLSATIFSWLCSRDTPSGGGVAISTVSRPRSFLVALKLAFTGCTVRAARVGEPGGASRGPGFSGVQYGPPPPLIPKWLKSAPFSQFRLNENATVSRFSGVAPSPQTLGKYPPLGLLVSRNGNAGKSLNRDASSNRSGASCLEEVEIVGLHSLLV